jgi:hypothetical protein
MPDEVVRACRQGELVIFAGAGISTESPLLLPRRFVDEIRAKLGRDADDPADFPSLMQAFEDRFGRRALLEQIHHRLTMIRSFPELDWDASQFHRELSALFQITEIFTTNWDTYFERECGAQPFVTAEDWAFWRSAKRRVFKLHGSIGNPASLVATESDYRRCHRALGRGVLGAHLRSILATKTVLFVGYSFGDPDFAAIYRLLAREMGDILPRSYIVTPSGAEPPDYLSRSPVIRTDGTFFLSTLREALPASEFTDGDRLESAAGMADLAGSSQAQIIAEYPVGEYPAVMFTLVYQDGFIHAFEHTSANYKQGDYWHRCYVEGMVDLYDRFAAEHRGQRQYYEAAYLLGYRNGLRWLLGEGEGFGRESPFFLFGLKEGEQPRSFEEFQELVPASAGFHKAATREAEKMTQGIGPGLVPHHSPVMSSAGVPRGSHS